MKITIKNMVCPRCIMTASHILASMGYEDAVKTASVAGTPTDDAIRAKVTALGYLYLGPTN